MNATTCKLCRTLWTLAQRFLLTSLLCSPGLHANAYVLSDDTGVAVTFTAPPRRIISLLPSISESVCALGKCALLVGVDRDSDFPAQLADVPKVGAGLDPNLEAIVALHPDFIMMSVSTRARQRLESLGIKTFAFASQNYADIKSMLERVGVIIDEPSAPQLWGDLEREITTIATKIPPTAKDMRIYVEVFPGPYAAGAGSYIGETLTKLGVQNIIPLSLGPFPKINPEFVVKADPDLIIIASGSATELSQRPGWQKLRALEHHRICALTPAQSKLLSIPGPRVALAANIIARCITEHGLSAGTPP